MREPRSSGYYLGAEGQDYEHDDVVVYSTREPHAPDLTDKARTPT